MDRYGHMYDLYTYVYVCLWLGVKIERAKIRYKNTEHEIKNIMLGVLSFLLKQVGSVVVAVWSRHEI